MPKFCPYLAASLQGKDRSFELTRLYRDGNTPHMWVDDTLLPREGAAEALKKTSKIAVIMRRTQI